MSSARDLGRGLAYIAPNFLGFALFTALPVLGACYMALHDGSFSTRIDPAAGTVQIDARYVGLDNFRKLIGFDRVEVDQVTVEAKGARRSLSVLVDKGTRSALLAQSGRVTLRVVDSHFLLFGGATQVEEQERGAIVASQLSAGSLWQARDPKFWFYLYNTLYFMLGIPLCMAASLGLAVLLNRKIRGRLIYRTLLFLPSVATGVAMFLVWRWIFNPNVGLLNSSLDSLGFLGGLRPDWLGDPALVRPSIIAMGVWTAMGGTNMILFLAGLQGIDPTLYEAAEIDGAGPWDKFIHITWPQLRPTTFFIFTTSLIGGFQMFDQAYVMTGGGPEGATTTIVYYVYQMMFRFQKMGYAAAIAIVLFQIILAVTLLNWWYGKRSNPTG